jgi:hypothetical protein
LNRSAVPWAHKVRRRKDGTFPLSLWARTPNCAWPRPAVGEGVRLLSGYGRSACPVRRAGCGKRRYGYTTKAPPDERGGNRYVQQPPRHISTPPRLCEIFSRHRASSPSLAGPQSSQYKKFKVRHSRPSERAARLHALGLRETSSLASPAER